MKPQRRPLLALIAAALVVMTVIPATAATRWDAFARSSLAGSGRAGMQLEVAPARVGRVAVRPGTRGNEAWAIGLSSARPAGWERGPAGQVVFLKRTGRSGWVVTGPPTDAAGRVVNPLLSSFALTAAGEGWAVGDRGTILHKAAGSDRWVVAPDSGRIPRALNSVSLAPDGSGMAVGVGPTILTLSRGRWTQQTVPTDMSTLTRELHAVSVVSADEAWAVATGQITGVDSTSLLIFRYAGSWARVTTGETIFDSPPSRAESGFLNRAAEAGAVVADASGAWVGGRIHPRPASQPEGDITPGDASRAFVLRVNLRGATTETISYCPDHYSDRTPDGVLDITKMCDRPFPTTPHHIASLAAAPDGSVFAGGLGLFKFSGEGWHREPNSNGYLISLAFGSATNGFAASSGDTLGAGGLIRSSVTTVGHWTASPKPPAIARWPQPQRELLESVALAGDGSGRAVAVGTRGAGIIKRGGLGWDSIDPPIEFAMHAVAWPKGGPAVAVGSEGSIFTLRGNAFEYSEGPEKRTMFGLAFSSAARGVAVGLGGGVFQTTDGRWSVDRSSPTTKDLYAVVSTPGGYVAVGRDATIMEGRPGAWRLRSEGRALLRRPDEDDAPSLYAAAVAADGSVWMGGQDSSLLVRDPSGRIRHAPAPIEGTVLALAARGDAVWASVGADADKFRGEAPSAQRGALLRYAAGGWTDVSLNRRVTVLRDEVDPSQFEDPVYSIALTDESTGWAVGGSPGELKNQAEGHFRSLPTGAVYRVALGGDPTPRTDRAPVPVKPGIAFAAFGETWCGEGLCSSALGTGNQADLVALRIRDEINEASRQPGGPKFVVFTGSMRRSGIPEELAQFRAYIQGFRIPVFAVPGTNDRFAGIEPGTGTAGVGGNPTGSTEHWQRIFSGMPQPWGHGGLPANIALLEDEQEKAPGAAATHFAFDYKVNGRTALRMVFLDSSTKSWGTPADQMPPQDQSVWLRNTLTQARTQGIPAIVVTNHPAFAPAEQPFPIWQPGAGQEFESTLVAGNASAVIAAGFRANLKDRIKVVIPLFITGGGGAPVGRQQGVGVSAATKLPTDGYYHAWHLLRVDGANRTVLGQATVTDDVYPVLESLALHSDRGLEIPAGQATTVTAIARGLNGGFSDPDQAKSVYLAYGRNIYPCGSRQQGEGICISDLALMPAFRFRSLRPEIANFVRRDPLNLYEPYRDRLPGGELGPVQPDGGADGMLCAFKLGTAPIEITAGMLRSVIEVTVGPGSGKCIDEEIQPTPTPSPPREPEPIPEPVEEPFLYLAPRVRPEVVVLFPPPPAPAVAPAPPGAPGVGRKEEHEVQTETEGHGEYDFTALPADERRRYAWTPVNTRLGRSGVAEDHAMWFAGLFALSAFAIAAAAVATRARRWQPVEDEVSR